MSGSRSRSRSPLSVRSETPSEKALLRALETLDPEGEDSQSNHKYESNLLVVSNVPPNWKWDKFRDFIVKNCSSPEVHSNLPHISTKKTYVSLKFVSSHTCLLCYKDLLGKEIEGKKLVIKRMPLPDRERQSSKNDGFAPPPARTMPRFIKITSYTADENETYGLSLSFLSSLGIKPPLQKCIFVGNLAVTIDRNKLMEVFSLAGKVVNISLIKSTKDIPKMSAKVEFDHAVEAVQAISMFNRQQLMGRVMLVQFDTRPNTVNLPAGLQSLGPGLGLQGEPLSDIRQLVEFQPLKQLLAKELAEMKAATTKELAQASSKLRNASTAGLGSLQNIMTPLNINTMGMNPLNPVPPVFGLNVQGQNIQTWQGLLQQNMGNDLASTLAALQAHSNTTNKTAVNTLAALQAHSNTHNNSQVNNTGKSAGFGQALAVDKDKRRSTSSNNGNSHSNSKSQSKYTDDRPDKERKSMTSSDMLVFNYLPPSVTVQALNNKMREIGELMFAEITGQGRAIVRFRNNQDAERCIKLFDRSKVDGQTIEVKFF